MTAPTHPAILAWSEAELQRNLVEQLQARGFLVHHTRPAMRKDGQYRTPIQGDKGFPDLVAVAGGILLVLELKAEKGRETREQRHWLLELSRALTGRVRGYVGTVRPRDYDRVLDEVDTMLAEVGR